MIVLYTEMVEKYFCHVGICNNEQKKCLLFLTAFCYHAFETGISASQIGSSTESRITWSVSASVSKTSMILRLTFCRPWRKYRASRPPKMRIPVYFFFCCSFVVSIDVWSPKAVVLDSVRTQNLSNFLCNLLLTIPYHYHYAAFV